MQSTATPKRTSAATLLPLHPRTELPSSERLKAEPRNLEGREAERLCERSGRSLLLRFEGNGEALEVRAPDGSLELTVRLTAEGPVLQLQSARVELVSTRAVTVKCERFEVEASEDVAISAGGDLVQRAHGRASTSVDGVAEFRARAIELEARLGDVSVTANDDVVVVGECIHLNP